MCKYQWSSINLERVDKINSKLDSWNYPLTTFKIKN